MPGTELNRRGNGMADLSTTVDKRGRRTKARTEQLEQQILDVLELDHPQSIRHVFYRMTDPRLPEPVEKTQHGYRQVQHRITALRRADRLPYGWITDATRRGYHVSTYNSRIDFLRDITGLYRADLWRDAGVYCEVWCESRSIAGVIEDDCRELAVSLYPAGGFSSITLAYQAAEYINEAVRVPVPAGRHFMVKPAVIFYIGDYDPAGVLIDVSAEQELRRHLAFYVDLAFERIAITEDQIIEHDLPTKVRKKTDRRALHVTETVEAEAMPARTLRALLRQRIEALLPANAIAAARAAEESEKAGLRAFVDIMEGHA